MRRPIVFLLALLLLALARPAPLQAQPVEPVDADVKLLDQHFGLHLGGSLGATGFSIGALVVGVQSLVMIGEETSNQAAQQRLILGLTLTSMGVGTVVSAVTGIQRNAVNWRSTRKRFASASPVQRRLLRESQVKRLRQMASQRAIGLIADGTFLAIGIVLMAVEATDLGLPLVLDGSLVLGIDIFRLVVDDQFAARWEERDMDSESGYFSERRRRPDLFPLPVILPGSEKGAPPGAAVLLVGAF